MSGNITKSAGTLNVPGTLNVGGNFTNAGTFAPTGTVNYTGAAAQNVAGGAYGTLGFSGAGVKTLSANASTTDRHHRQRRRHLRRQWCRA